MKLSISLLSLLLASTSAMADVKVMASIKPVQSLVAAVMQGVGTPGVIIDGANSPHTYTMKPSDAQALSDADVVFWVGEELEAFLKKPLSSLSNKATQVALMDVTGMRHLTVREGNGFDAHDDHGEHEGEHDHADEHNHGAEHDPHVWLDPENAKIIVKAAAETLAQADAPNAATYAKNAATTIAKLDALSADMKSTTAGSKNKFIVFHDAYQYVEKHLGLEASGAIAIHPENPPGAKAIREIRKRLTADEVTCVYTEPQFDPKLVSVIVEGTNVKTGVLDPLGASLEAGPDMYFTLLRNLTTGIKGC